MLLEETIRHIQPAALEAVQVPCKYPGLADVRNTFIALILLIMQTFTIRYDSIGELISSTLRSQDLRKADLGVYLKEQSHEVHCRLWINDCSWISEVFIFFCSRSS